MDSWNFFMGADLGSDVYDLWHKGALEEAEVSRPLAPLTDLGDELGRKLVDQRIVLTTCTRGRG